MPGHTIDAILKQKNGHALTREQLALLRDKFNELNGGVVPRVGQSFKIPLLASLPSTAPASSSTS